MNVNTCSLSAHSTWLREIERTPLGVCVSAFQLLDAFLKPKTTYLLA